MPSRRTCLLLVAACAVATATTLPALASTPDKLFFIQRSKNANEVHYDARVDAEGNLDAKNPVDGYWRNKGPNGSWSREELSVFQKLAYGWDTEATGGGTYALKLRAFPQRAMWIVKINGHWVVQTTIAGKQAYLRRLYVATDESGVMPRVLYVDVFGDDAASGAALTEHLVNP